MFCPECGREVSADDSFCTSCGCFIRPSLQQTGTTTYSYVPEGQPTETYTDPYVFEETYRKKSSKGAAVAAVLVVAIIVIAAAVMLPMVQTNLHGSLYGKSFGSGLGSSAMMTDTGYNVVASDGFQTNDAELTVNGNEIIVTLSDAVMAGYGTTDWTITCDTTAAFTTDTANNKATIVTNGFGTFTLKANCSNGIESHLYTFTVSVQIYRAYEWKFDGGRFSFDISFDYSEYYEQAHKAPYHRSIGEGIGNIHSYTETKNFVIVSTTIENIESYLEDLYTKAYGSCSTNQNFANFILSFVQINFEYQLDSVQYLSEEYYAYPMETIYSGKGDCEDTSFLVDAIYKKAGYKTAVVILPGHAMAAVALSDYKEPELSSGEILKHMVNGIWYYACETTVSGYQPVGASGGTYNGQYYSYYIGHSSGAGGYYGFYPVEDSE